MRTLLLTSVVIATAQISALSSGCCTTSCSGSGYDYGINPPFVFADYCSCNWTGHIDYLYWKADVSGAKWTTDVKAGSTSNGLTGNIDINDAGKNKLVDFDWDSGFRVGLGYQFPCDKWALTVDWSHYRTDTKKQLSENSMFISQDVDIYNFDTNYLTTPYSNLSQFVTLPFFFGETATNLVGDSSLKGTFKLQYNQIDLSLSRNFYVGPCMRITPHMGVSFLSLQETETVCIDYKPINFFITDNTPAASIVVNGIRFTGIFKSEFKGVGIKGGLDSEWEICNGFGFYGGGSIAAYYGTFDTLNHSALIGAPLSYATQISSGFSLNDTLDYPQTFESLRCTTDLSLGLIWNTSFNCDKNMFTFKALWEHHCFLGFNMIPTVDIKPAALIFEPAGQNFNIFRRLPGQTQNVSYADGSIFFHGFTFSFAVAF